MAKKQTNAGPEGGYPPDVDPSYTGAPPILEEMEAHERLWSATPHRQDQLLTLMGRYIAAEIAERGIIALQRGHRGGSAVPDVIEAALVIAEATLKRLEAGVGGKVE